MTSGGKLKCVTLCATWSLEDTAFIEKDEIMCVCILFSCIIMNVIQA